MAAREVRDRLQFFDRIDGAAFGGLCQADGFGLGVMHEALLEMGEPMFDCVRCELGVRAFQCDELGAMGEEFGGAAFIDRDVAFGMTQDRAMRRHQRGERKRIGRGSGDDRIDKHLVFENVAQAGAHALGVFVVAIGTLRSLIGLPQRGHDFGHRPIGIVAGEIHGWNLLDRQVVLG